MVGRDNVTFRFRIDLKDMTIKGKQAVQILDEIARKSGNASQGMDRLATSSQKAGRQTAASAINFQTATQGMLNLSTAAVQTFTSISNLDRANNRAKQSIIAVARAEDLLANKQERLSSLTKAGAANTQKALNIEKEIVTARADLIVKTEKMGIEQDAVNDIYLLFATNIANVTISSLQTITILVGHEKVARVAATLATKLHSIATMRYNVVLKTSTSATAVNTLTQRLGTIATIKATFAAHGLAAGLRAVTVSFAPLLIATVAITAAFLIYENNVGGVKDAINGLLGIQEDETKAILAEREELDKLNKSFDEHTEKIFRLPRTYAEARIQLQQLTVQINESNRALGGIPSGFDNALAFGGIPSAFGDVPTTVIPFGIKAQNIINNRITSANDIGTSGTAGAGEFKISGGATAFSLGGRPLGTAGFKIQQEFLLKTKEGLIGSIRNITGINTEQALGIIDSGDIFFLPDDLQGRINTFYKSQQAIVQRLSQGGFISNEIEQATVLAGLKQFSPESFALQQHAKAVKQGVEDFNISKKVNLQFQATRAGLTVKEFQRRKAGGGNTDATKISAAFAIRRNIEQGKFLGLSDSPFDRLIAASFNKPGGAILSSNNFLFKDTSNFGENRLAVFQQTGKDIGAIADSLSMSAAKELARKEQQLQPFANTTGGFGNLFGAFNATSFFQVAQGSIKVPAWVEQQRAIQDANMNRLRNGGTRKLDSSGFALPLSVSGAVTGGFTSIDAFRKNEREKFRSSSNIAAVFLGSLGIFNPVGSSGGPASVARSRSIEQAKSIGRLLQRSGLGVSSFGIRKTHRGGGYVQSGASWNEHRQSVIQMNQNTLARAGQIDILQEGFGLNFYGSAAALTILQTKVAEQDALIKSIGLNRPEAFQIIDTDGRGREEIDDRLRYNERLEAMSSGTSSI